MRLSEVKMLNSAVLLLEETASKFPDCIALEDGSNKITYAQYNLKAKSIGTYILNLDDHVFKQPIVVLLPKSCWNLIAFMGILYSGNIYVPLDDKMPPVRIAKILENLNPKYIITNSCDREILESLDIKSCKILLIEELCNCPADEGKITKTLNNIIDLDPIYIKYTSGSTGTPKGVTISHRGVLDYSNWVVETFHITQTDIFGNQSPFYFDNSILDIYSCLRTGAKLIIIPELLFQYQNKLPEFIEDNNINVIFWVPTIFSNIANSNILKDGIMKNVTKILFCGEPMHNKTLNIWRKFLPHALYANLYGPTEITDACTYYIVDREFCDNEALPIGIPCKNTGILILTDDNKKAKIGEIGELCVLGCGLALSYWNNREQTEKAFQINPLNQAYKEPIYRTGDLAYINDDGLIMWVGRKDYQIKYKGNRIELGEIETAINSLSYVSNCCVIFSEKRQKIAAFVESGRDIVLKELKKDLESLIPSYMLPNKLTVMKNLPYNANRKIDRVKLKETLEH